MRFDWIIKNEIAVGSFPDKHGISYLERNGVRAIVSLTSEELPEEKIPKNFVYGDFPMDDVCEPDLYNLKECLLYTDFLKTVKLPFFVHCKDGLVRSPFFAAAYLIYQGKSANSAVEMVRKRTGIVFEKCVIEKLNDIEKYKMLLYPNKETLSFYKFNELVKILRKQCPWDREQTHSLLIPELIEEPLELVEAIKKNDFKGMEEELGDVALQVFLHSVIASEEGKFDISDVFNGIFEKMYRRHPHVFGKSNVKSSEAVLSQWEEIKKKEKKGRPVDIAKVLASLITAFDVQEEARNAGFDFDNVNQILDKIAEETKEVNEALKNGENISEELGDLLFSVINLARFLQIDPAHALFLSVDKFRKRFEYVRKTASLNLNSMSSEEKDNLWNDAKKNV